MRVEPPFIVPERAGLGIIARFFTPVGWSDARIAVYLFLSLWLTYGFLGAKFQHTNSITRIALIFSILDYKSLTIDNFASLTIDKALFQGHYFADKPPGMSFTALPFVALFVGTGRALHFITGPITGRTMQIGMYIASFFTSGLFTAASAAMLYRLSRHWRVSQGAALFGTLAYALATPTLGWATVFFSHAVDGACLIIAFTVIVLAADRVGNRRADISAGCVAGLLLSWTVTVELIAAPAALLIASFGMWRLRAFARDRRRNIIAAAASAGIAGVLPMLVYNWAAFGSPFHLGYENVVGFAGMSQGYFGLGSPRPKVLGAIVYGAYRGILWLSPLLVAAPLGYYAAFRTLPVSTVLTLLGVPLAYFLINSSYYYWDGGWSTGPRHVIASMPFLIVPLVFLWQRGGIATRAMLSGLALLSFITSLVCASVSMTVDTRYANPLFDSLLPHFLDGAIENAFTRVGIKGLASLAGIPLLWLAAALPLLAWRTGTEEAGG